MVRTVTSSPWTSEDRALLLAYEQYKQTLCPGCHHPKETAWHLDNGGYFEPGARFVCHACTAMRDSGDGSTVDPVEYGGAVDTRDYAEDPLPGHYTQFGVSDHVSQRPPAHDQPPRGEETL